MKKIIFILTVAFFAANCTKTNETEDLNLKDLNLALSVEMSSSSVENTPSNISLLIGELTDRLFNAEEHSSENIYIKNVDGSLQIKITETGSSEIPDFAGKPCAEQSTRCYSRECVKTTLESILGDGKRDVIIKYERNLTNVLISWQYQDC